MYLRIPSPLTLAALSLLPPPTLAQNPLHTGTFAITNIRIFSGSAYIDHTSSISPGGSPTKSIIIQDGHISSISSHPLAVSSDPDYPVIDGHHGTLLPGFIDTHVHVDDAVTDLLAMRAQGITTAFDMACHVGKEACDAHNLARYTAAAPFETGSKEWGAYVTNVSSFAPFPELFQAYAPAVAPVGALAHMAAPGTQLRSIAQAEEHVAARIAEGADQIKIIVTTPGFDAEMVETLVRAAREGGKVTVCHAADAEAFMVAVRAGCAQVHHVPVDRLLTRAEVEEVVGRGVAVAPTLIQMKRVIEATDGMWGVVAQRVWMVVKGFLLGKGLRWPGRTYETARGNVRLLAKGGVELLVGTDATGVEGPVVMTVNMRDGLGLEMQLMAEAGVENERILEGATYGAARRFGLHGDRGVIHVGRKADLVLVDGDPVEDIGNARRVSRVWVGGVEADLDAVRFAQAEQKEEL